MLAAEKDHAKVVKCLISAGADLSVIDMVRKNRLYHNEMTRRLIETILLIFRLVATLAPSQ